jgi:hypothetical protein
MPEYARIAYETYAHHLALHGTWIQGWATLQPDIKEAWHLAVIVAIDAHDAHIRDEGAAAWQRSQSQSS